MNVYNIIIVLISKTVQFNCNCTQRLAYYGKYDFIKLTIRMIDDRTVLDSRFSNSADTNHRNSKSN